MKKIYVFMMAMLTVSVMQAQEQGWAYINSSGGEAVTNPYYFTEFNNALYFQGTSGTYGVELWKTNGTQSGTVMIEDLDTQGDASPTNLVVYKGDLYFSTYVSGYETYKCDTEDNVTLVDGSTSFYSPMVIGDLLYFVDEAGKLNTYDGNTKSEVTNTNNQTYSIADKKVAYLDGEILFYGNVSDLGTTNKELFKYNINDGVFSFVKEIAPNVGTPPNWHAAITEFKTMGDNVYFSAINNISQLWVTDGSESGTMIVAESSDLTNVKSMYAWNNVLYFNASGTTGSELYAYNPATPIVTNLSNLGSALAPANHQPGNFCEYDSRLFYTGVDGGIYLYSTDGNDISEECKNPSNFAQLGAFDNKLFANAYSSSSPAGDTEVWMFNPNPTAIGDEINVNAIKVSPNPSYGYVVVEGLESVSATYELYDLSGKVIEKGLVGADKKINYGVEAGVYLLRVVDASNSKVVKIMVK